MVNLFFIQKNKSAIILPTSIKERFSQILGSPRNNCEFYFWFVLTGICLVTYLFPYFKLGFINGLFLNKITRGGLFLELKSQTDNVFLKQQIYFLMLIH